MNPVLSSILDRYTESHKNRTNILIHKVCVPLIMLSILGLLHTIPGLIDYSYVAVIAALGYYFKFRNLSVYFVFLAQVIPMLTIIYLLPHFNFLYWLAIFAFAWIGQFIGHNIEGKKPSFFDDLFFLLIGPIWILKRFLK